MNFRALLTHPQAVDVYAKRITRNALPENARGDLVLYWMHSARRMRKNLALNFAIEKANDSGLPVVVVEADHDAVDVVAPVASRARFVVTDEFPTRKQTLAFPAFTVDGNGIFPMRAFEKELYSAKVLRDRAKKIFDEYWSPIGDVEARHGLHAEVTPATQRAREAALERLAAVEGRGSGLSPYLHSGAIGIHEVVEHVVHSDIDDESANEFLEQAIIRRELSFNLCFHRDDYMTLAPLPDWAKRTLDRHRDDRRSPVYSFEEFERAATHDDVWNYAQRELLDTGMMHSYLRMLWGKKIIEWSATPEEAQATMIRLFDTYALDGRDPNTYAGILWCFGKHDRPWYPERPIFGTIRYMSSDAARRKTGLTLRIREASVRNRAAI